jgi:NADP-dependent 3-hydroxy acid dehydrogenase YdfG
MLNKKVFLITGATGAVAGSIIKKFAEQGAELILLSRQANQINLGTPLMADLGTLEGAEQAVAFVLKTHGRLDGVIHTVGSFAIESILEYKPSTYDQMLNTNLRSTVNIAAATTPELIKTQGFFGTIAAGQVIRGAGAKMALYTAAKGAVVLFIKSLAAEIKTVRYGIVYPMGTIDTASNRHEMPNTDPSTWISPEEIAEAFMYMATRSNQGQVQEIQLHT